MIFLPSRNIVGSKIVGWQTILRGLDNIQTYQSVSRGVLSDATKNID